MPLHKRSKEFEENIMSQEQRDLMDEVLNIKSTRILSLCRYGFYHQSVSLKHQAKRSDCERNDMANMLIESKVFKYIAFRCATRLRTLRRHQKRRESKKNNIGDDV